MSKVLITGVTGQIGSYMAELLVDKGHEVVGMVRRAATPNFENLQATLDNPCFSLVTCDIMESGLSNIISKGNFDYVFNFAAQSHVHVSFDNPVSTFNYDALGVLNILEAIRHYSPHTKFYQASSSEMYGDQKGVLCADGVWRQNEKTTLNPLSPYAVAKVAAHHLVRVYRESCGLFAVCGIMFNNESPRRGENFVTRKITKYVADLIVCGFNRPLYLGNLHAYRDWSHTLDTVEGVWAMINNVDPIDYVIASGQTHSIIDFLEEAFATYGLLWEDYVVTDPGYIRPNEVNYLCGDSTLLRSLGWAPKFTFSSLVKDMLEHDTRQKTLQVS